MPEKLISDLLDLPERIRKGDFVLNLSKGVTEPEKTLEAYVVTAGHGFRKQLWRGCSRLG